MINIILLIVIAMIWGATMHLYFSTKKKEK